MHDEVVQFDSISATYAAFVAADPVRNFLHYPAVIGLLGAVKDKNILDIGCGDGLLVRKLAQGYGAHMTGYDKAADLIALAEDEEHKHPLGIKYSVDDPLTFEPTAVFNEAFSVMVICYSPNASYLGYFFDSAYRSLERGGRFISVTFNPDFDNFDEVVANRIFEQQDGRIKVNFLDPQTTDAGPIFTAFLNQFSKDEYIGAAQAAGFEKVTWVNIYPTSDGVSLLGKKFWESYNRAQPYIIMIAEK
jgi:toxoflavin synthase